MADTAHNTEARRRTTGRRHLVRGAAAVLAGSWAGTALAAPEAAPEPVAAAQAPPDAFPEAHPLLEPVQPLDLHRTIRQAIIGEAGNGAQVGDIALVAPTPGYRGACTYACQFPGEGVSIWMAETRPVPGGTAWALQIWQGDWRFAEARTVTRAELDAAVLGYCVGWFHTGSAHIMANGSGEDFA